MVNLFQLILLGLIGLILVHIASRWRRGELGSPQFLAWTAFWLAGAAAAAFPTFDTRLAQWVGVGRGVDLVIYFSLVAVFYAIFRILVKLERANRDITEVVRLLAIEVRLREERDGAGSRSPSAL